MMAPRTGSHPHEIEILDRAGGDGSEALVERLAQHGEDLHIALKLGDGRLFETRLSLERAGELELSEGQIRLVRLPEPPVLAG